MPENFKAIIRSVTPPVLWDLAKSASNKPKANSNTTSPLGVERPAEYYEQMGTNDHLKTHYSKSHYYPTWLVISDYLLKRGSNYILDIGCGPGQFSELLLDNGFKHYVGIDFSKLRIERAKAVCPEYTFLCKDIFEEGLIERQSYDTVVMTEFLEHINEDISVIRRITPGTKIFGTVPDYGGQAHVRKYETADSVAERYGDLISEIRVRTVIVDKRRGRHLQMFDGIRSNQN